LFIAVNWSFGAQILGSAASAINRIVDAPIIERRRQGSIIAGGKER
jgi:hypothetical protein